MPFDRDSFLRGVITGMRLPRTPGGQKPFIPVPSGKYILSESGVRLITEDSNPAIESNATFYATGRYYPYSDQLMTIICTNAFEWFYWLNGEELRQIPYSLSETGGTGGIYTKEGNKDPRLRVGFSFQNYTSKSGDVFYRILSTPFTSYIPNGMIPFEGTEDELKAFIASAHYKYMFTE